MSLLTDLRCQPCGGDTDPLTREEAVGFIKGLHEDWKLDDRCQEIRRLFLFENFHQTMAFVNAVAWISHQEDHHPALEVAYGQCAVRYSTHAIGGLSENDFICAAKVDVLLDIEE